MFSITNHNLIYFPWRVRRVRVVMGGVGEKTVFPPPAAAVLTSTATETPREVFLCPLPPSRSVHWQISPDAKEKSAHQIKHRKQNGFTCVSWYSEVRKGHKESSL